LGVSVTNNNSESKYIAIYSGSKSETITENNSALSSHHSMY